MTVIAQATERGCLAMTPHPLQRTGAWAVALLSGRPHPREVNADDLDAAAARIIDDVVDAAVAEKEKAAYDWWKVLFALFPNAKPTHAKRSRDRAVLHGEIEAFFAADAPEASARWPCTFCGEPTAVLWSKSMLPMFDTTKFLNTLPPGTAGWPVCRACRIALWAMPYGAAVTAGSATVMTCDDEAVEREFVTANTLRTRQIRHAGFSGMPADASPERVTLWALRRHTPHRPAAATLWAFKNDNQEPWLQVTWTRLAVVRFLRAVHSNPDARRGWRRFEAVMTRRGSGGETVVSGADAVARMVFDKADREPDRLLSRLVAHATEVERCTGRALTDWRALAATYLKEMCGMDAGVLKPVTALLVEWITQEANPRGRFNEYRRVAGHSSRLQRLLMEASARLLLDGRSPADITGVTGPLLASTQDGWRLRGQLFFEVVAELVARNVPIGTRDAADDDDEPDGQLVGADPIGEEDEESA